MHLRVIPTMSQRPDGGWMRREGSWANHRLRPPAVIRSVARGSGAFDDYISRGSFYPVLTGPGSTNLMARRTRVSTRRPRRRFRRRRYGRIRRMV